MKIKINNDEKFAYLSVEDNGGGIDKNVIDEIFKPYFTTKEDTKGTGLGLYMSKQIIDQFNAEITAATATMGPVF
ncbi:HAMP domain-containing sensor histidine kinase [Campylobacter concisus]